MRGDERPRLPDPRDKETHGGRPHLSRGLDSAEDEEEGEGPGQQQAEHLTQVHPARLVDGRGDVQGLPVEEVLGGRGPFALLVRARHVGVQRALCPGQNGLGVDERTLV